MVTPGLILARTLYGRRKRHHAAGERRGRAGARTLVLVVVLAMLAPSVAAALPGVASAPVCDHEFCPARARHMAMKHGEHSAAPVAVGPACTCSRHCHQGQTGSSATASVPAPASCLHGACNHDLPAGARASTAGGQRGLLPSAMLLVKSPARQPALAMAGERLPSAPPVSIDRPPRLSTAN